MSQTFKRALPHTTRLVAGLVLFVQLFLFINACLSINPVAQQGEHAAMQMTLVASSALEETHSAACKINAALTDETLLFASLSITAFIAVFFFVFKPLQFNVSHFRDYRQSFLRRFVPPPISIAFCSFQH